MWLLKLQYIRMRERGFARCLCERLLRGASVLLSCTQSSRAQLCRGCRAGPAEQGQEVLGELWDIPELGALPGQVPGRQNVLLLQAACGTCGTQGQHHGFLPRSQRSCKHYGRNLNACFVYFVVCLEGRDWMCL